MLSHSTKPLASVHQSTFIVIRDTSAISLLSQSHKVGDVVRPMPALPQEQGHASAGVLAPVGSLRLPGPGAWVNYSVLRVMYYDMKTLHKNAF